MDSFEDIKRNLGNSPFAMLRVDVHHHYVPEKFREYGDRYGEWPSPPWSVESDKEMCTKFGVKFSMISLSSPGAAAVTDPDLAAELAHDANLRGAEVQKQNPESYGLFASVPPLAQMKAVLDEVAFAFDTLHADGIILFTSYEGKYLGHSDFAPLWKELNARSAVVFVHPTSPAGWKAANEILAAPMLDFTWETTRCAWDLIVTDTLKSASNCKIILSHAGGCLPWMWYRPAVTLFGSGRVKKTVDEMREEVKSFYFDTALSGNPENMELLMKVARKERILYGSDTPYARHKTIGMFTDQLDGMDMSAEMRERIAWRNAVELFPRLKALFPQGDA